MIVQFIPIRFSCSEQKRNENFGHYNNALLQTGKQTGKRMLKKVDIHSCILFFLDFSKPYFNFISRFESDRVTLQLNVFDN